ncbi:MAG: N-acetyltransferase [Proteobacteria bacterium]|nr:N-acetyltransferase [Pseudomonadota bacterium]
MLTRPEQPEDHAAIHATTGAAFRSAPYSGGNEARIVDALRAAGALTLSLVACEGEAVIGHVAFSPVRIGGADLGWFGLGPVSVRPDRQGAGVGSALIREGLDRLRVMGAAGCVVFGEPGYYGRFGFETDAALAYPGAPDGYFQRLPFRGEAPSGEVAYDAAFEVA